MYARWAGVSKKVQPEVTSHLTTARTRLMAGSSFCAILGKADNALRWGMEEIAVESGLTFIVNVVLNRNGATVRGGELSWSPIERA